MKYKIMDPEKYPDYFEAYIESKLSEEELQIFETKLKEDRDFKLQFEAHKAVVNHFRELGRNELKSELKLIHKEMERKKIRTRRIFTWTVSMAAIFAGLIFIVWQPTQSSNSELFAKYATPYPCDLNIEISSTHLRGVENLSKEESMIAQSAMNDYKNERHKAVVDKLMPILEYPEKSPELLFYLSISQMKSGLEKQALGNFNYLSSLTGFRYREPAEYYHALMLLKLGEKSDSKALLIEIKDRNGKYSKDAGEIIKKMRWWF